MSSESDGGISEWLDTTSADQGLTQEAWKKVWSDSTCIVYPLWLVL